MKSLICSISIILCSFLLQAQTYPVPISVAKAPTQIGLNNALQGKLILTTFTDTSAANAEGYLKNYDGALIKTTSPIIAIWYRDLANTIWVQLLPSGGGSGGLGAWTTTLNTNIPTDVSLNGYFGTTAANGIGFYTTGLQRLILPAGGLARQSGGAYKFMLFDTTNKTWGYGDGGSGTNYWTLSGSNLFNNSGTNVGINNNSPSVALDVGGDIRGGVNITYGAGIFKTDATNGIVYNGDFNGDANGSYAKFDDGTVTASLIGYGQVNVSGNVKFGNYGSGSITGTPTHTLQVDVNGNVIEGTVYSGVPTWQQTLTAGSTLATDNTITGGGTSFTWNNILDYAINTTDNAVMQTTVGAITSAVQLASNSAVLAATSTNTRASYFIASYDTLYINPSLGHLKIDTLNYSANTTDSMMVWNKSNGLVGMRATPLFLSGSATLDFGNTSAGASTDLTITVTGAADGDVVSLGTPNASTSSNGVFTAWVSSANTVTVRFTNTNLVSAIDPASGTFKVKILQ